jgi:hypothetical protein
MIDSSAWKNGTANPVAVSSVTLNRNMWDKMGWTPDPVPTGYLAPSAGTYIVSATTTETEDPRSANAEVKVIGVASLSTVARDMTITSVIENPGDDQSVCIDAPNSSSPVIPVETLTFTATPEPGSIWPGNYPIWKINGTQVQTGGNTYSFSSSGKNPGKYTVSVECGNIVAIDVYVVSCEYRIIVDTPGSGAILIDFSGPIPTYSVGHVSWRLNVMPIEAVDIKPLKPYKDILRKDIGFHANSMTVVLSGEATAPTPTLHIPDEAAGKLRTYKVPLADLLAGAAFTNLLKTAAGNYRIGTRCIATKTVSGVTITPINWTHATTRNCANLAMDAGGACGVTLPSAFGTWTGMIAGFTVEYDGDMPWVLHGRL